MAAVHGEQRQPESIRWFRRTAAPSLRLVCIPYAGGSAAGYRSWAPLLPPDIAFGAVELPGHGDRLSEKPCSSSQQLVDLLLPELRAGAAPLILFGHSMGALLAFELQSALENAYGVAAQALVLSGACPDRCVERGEYSDAELLEELLRYQGTPREILQSPELLQLYLPILRADFEVCNSLRRAAKTRVQVPITVLGGSDDPMVSRESLAEWRQRTTGSCTVRVLPGGHFFLRPQEPRVVAIVQAVCRRVLPQAPGLTGVGAARAGADATSPVGGARP